MKCEDHSHPCPVSLATSTYDRVPASLLAGLSSVILSPPHRGYLCLVLVITKPECYKPTLPISTRRGTGIYTYVESFHFSQWIRQYFSHLRKRSMDRSPWPSYINIILSFLQTIFYYRPQHYVTAEYSRVPMIGGEELIFLTFEVGVCFHLSQNK